MENKSCRQCSISFMPIYPWQVYCGKECSTKCLYLRRKLSGRRNDILKKFGINSAEYQKQLEMQGGGCAICGKQETTLGKKYLAVDHHHATGKVRGLLCGSCNKGLGHFQDNPALLSEAVLYLLQHPNNIDNTIIKERLRNRT